MTRHRFALRLLLYILLCYIFNCGRTQFTSPICQTFADRLQTATGKWPCYLQNSYNVASNTLAQPLNQATTAEYGTIKSPYTWTRSWMQGPKVTVTMPGENLYGSQLSSANDSPSLTTTILSGQNPQNTLTITPSPLTTTDLKFTPSLATPSFPMKYGLNNLPCEAASKTLNLGLQVPRTIFGSCINLALEALTPNVISFGNNLAYGVNSVGVTNEVSNTPNTVTVTSDNEVKYGIVSNTGINVAGCTPCNIVKTFIINPERVANNVVMSMVSNAGVNLEACSPYDNTFNINSGKFTNNAALSCEAKTALQTFTDDDIGGNYIYPTIHKHKSIIHACLAGYDNEIYNIINDIKETDGNEIEVHFYLFSNCIFNHLCSHMTTIKNLQDILAKYHHYICLNKKYVESYNAMDQCWYIQKLIMIPGFNHDFDKLNDDLRVDEFSKMCQLTGKVKHDGFQPVVLEVEEKVGKKAETVKQIMDVENKQEVSLYELVQKTREPKKKVDANNDDDDYLSWPSVNNFEGKNFQAIRSKPIETKMVTYGTNLQRPPFDTNFGQQQRFFNSGQHLNYQGNGIQGTRTDISKYICTDFTEAVDKYSEVREGIEFPPNPLHYTGSANTYPSVGYNNYYGSSNMQNVKDYNNVNNPDGVSGKVYNNVCYNFNTDNGIDKSLHYGSNTAGNVGNNYGITSTNNVNPFIENLLQNNLKSAQKIRNQPQAYITSYGNKIPGNNDYFQIHSDIDGIKVPKVLQQLPLNLFAQDDSAYVQDGYALPVTKNINNLKPLHIDNQFAQYPFENQPYTTTFNAINPKTHPKVNLPYNNENDIKYPRNNIFSYGNIPTAANIPSGVGSCIVWSNKAFDNKIQPKDNNVTTNEGTISYTPFIKASNEQNIGLQLGQFGSKIPQVTIDSIPQHTPYIQMQTPNNFIFFTKPQSFGNIITNFGYSTTPSIKYGVPFKDYGGIAWNRPQHYAKQYFDPSQRILTPNIMDQKNDIIEYNAKSPYYSHAVPWQTQSQLKLQPDTKQEIYEGNIILPRKPDNAIVQDIEQYGTIQPKVTIFDPNNKQTPKIKLPQFDNFNSYVPKMGWIGANVPKMVQNQAPGLIHYPNRDAYLKLSQFDHFNSNLPKTGPIGANVAKLTQTQDPNKFGLTTKAQWPIRCLTTPYTGFITPTKGQFSTKTPEYFTFTPDYNKMISYTPSYEVMYPKSRIPIIAPYAPAISPENDQLITVEPGYFTPPLEYNSISSNKPYDPKVNMIGANIPQVIPNENKISSYVEPFPQTQKLFTKAQPSFSPIVAPCGTNITPYKENTTPSYSIGPVQHKYSPWKKYEPSHYAGEMSNYGPSISPENGPNMAKPRYIPSGMYNTIDSIIKNYNNLNSFFPQPKPITFTIPQEPFVQQIPDNFNLIHTAQPVGPIVVPYAPTASPNIDQLGPKYGVPTINHNDIKQFYNINNFLPQMGGFSGKIPQVTIDGILQTPYAQMQTPENDNLFTKAQPFGGSIIEPFRKDYMKPQLFVGNIITPDYSTIPKIRYGVPFKDYGGISWTIPQYNSNMPKVQPIFVKNQQSSSQIQTPENYNLLTKPQSFGGNMVTPLYPTPSVYSTTPKIRYGVPFKDCGSVSWHIPQLKPICNKNQQPSFTQFHTPDLRSIPLQIPRNDIPQFNSYIPQEQPIYGTNQQPPFPQFETPYIGPTTIQVPPTDGNIPRFNTYMPQLQPVYSKNQQPPFAQSTIPVQVPPIGGKTPEFNSYMPQVQPIYGINQQPPFAQTQTPENYNLFMKPQSSGGRIDTPSYTTSSGYSTIPKIRHGIPFQDYGGIAWNMPKFKPQVRPVEPPLIPVEIPPIGTNVPQFNSCMPQMQPIYSKKPEPPFAQIQMPYIRPTMVQVPQISGTVTPYKRFFNPVKGQFIPLNPKYAIPLMKYDATASNIPEYNNIKYYLPEMKQINGRIPQIAQSNGKLSPYTAPFVQVQRPGALKLFTGLLQGLISDTDKLITKYTGFGTPSMGSAITNTPQSGSVKYYPPQVRQFGTNIYPTPIQQAPYMQIPRPEDLRLITQPPKSNVFTPYKELMTPKPSQFRTGMPSVGFNDVPQYNAIQIPNPDNLRLLTPRIPFGGLESPSTGQFIVPKPQFGIPLPKYDYISSFTTQNSNYNSFSPQKTQIDAIFPQIAFDPNIPKTQFGLPLLKYDPFNTIKPQNLNINSFLPQIPLPGSTNSYLPKAVQIGPQTSTPYLPKMTQVNGNVPQSMVPLYDGINSYLPKAAQIGGSIPQAIRDGRIQTPCSYLKPAAKRFMTNAQPYFSNIMTPYVPISPEFNQFIKSIPKLNIPTIQYRPSTINIPQYGNTNYYLPQMGTTIPQNLSFGSKISIPMQGPNSFNVFGKPQPPVSNIAALYVPFISRENTKPCYNMAPKVYNAMASIIPQNSNINNIEKLQPPRGNLVCPYIPVTSPKYVQPSYSMTRYMPQNDNINYLPKKNSSGLPKLLPTDIIQQVPSLQIQNPENLRLLTLSKPFEGYETPTKSQNTKLQPQFVTLPKYDYISPFIPQNSKYGSLLPQNTQFYAKNPYMGGAIGPNIAQYGNVNYYLPKIGTKIPQIGPAVGNIVPYVQIQTPKDFNDFTKIPVGNTVTPNRPILDPGKYQLINAKPVYGIPKLGSFIDPNMFPKCHIEYYQPQFGQNRAILPQTMPHFDKITPPVSPTIGQQKPVKPEYGMPSIKNGATGFNVPHNNNIKYNLLQTVQKQGEIPPLLPTNQTIRQPCAQIQAPTLYGVPTVGTTTPNIPIVHVQKLVPQIVPTIGQITPSIAVLTDKKITPYKVPIVQVQMPGAPRLIPNTPHVSHAPQIQKPLPQPVPTFGTTTPTAAVPFIGTVTPTTSPLGQVQKPLPQSVSNIVGKIVPNRQVQTPMPKAAEFFDEAAPNLPAAQTQTSKISRLIPKAPHIPLSPQIQKLLPTVATIKPNLPVAKVQKPIVVPTIPYITTLQDQKQLPQIAPIMGTQTPNVSPVSRIPKLGSSTLIPSTPQIQSVAYNVGKITYNKSPVAQVQKPLPKIIPPVSEITTNIPLVQVHKPETSSLFPHASQIHKPTVVPIPTVASNAAVPTVGKITPNIAPIVQIQKPIDSTITSNIPAVIVQTPLSQTIPTNGQITPNIAKPTIGTITAKVPVVQDQKPLLQSVPTHGAISPNLPNVQEVQKPPTQVVPNVSIITPNIPAIQVQKPLSPKVPTVSPITPNISPVVQVQKPIVGTITSNKPIGLVQKPMSQRVLIASTQTPNRASTVQVQKPLSQTVPPVGTITPNIPVVHVQKPLPQGVPNVGQIAPNIPVSTVGTIRSNIPVGQVQKALPQTVPMVGTQTPNIAPVVTVHKPETSTLIPNAQNKKPLSLVIPITVGKITPTKQVQKPELTKSISNIPNAQIQTVPTIGTMTPNAPIAQGQKPLPRVIPITVGKITPLDQRPQSSRLIPKVQLPTYHTATPYTNVEPAKCKIIKPQNSIIPISCNSAINYYTPEYYYDNIKQQNNITPLTGNNAINYYTPEYYYDNFDTHLSKIPHIDDKTYKVPIESKHQPPYAQIEKSGSSKLIPKTQKPVVKTVLPQTSNIAKVATVPTPTTFASTKPEYVLTPPPISLKPTPNVKSTAPIDQMVLDFIYSPSKVTPMKLKTYNAPPNNYAPQAKINDYDPATNYPTSQYGRSEEGDIIYSNNRPIQYEMQPNNANVQYYSPQAEQNQMFYTPTPLSTYPKPQFYSPRHYNPADYATYTPTIPFKEYTVKPFESIGVLPNYVQPYDNFKSIGAVPYYGIISPGPFKTNDLPQIGTYATYPPDMSFRQNTGTPYGNFKPIITVPYNLNIPFAPFTSTNYMPQVDTSTNAPQITIKQPYDTFRPTAAEPSNINIPLAPPTSTNYIPQVGILGKYGTYVPEINFKQPYMSKPRGIDPNNANIPFVSYPQVNSPGTFATYAPENTFARPYNILKSAFKEPNYKIVPPTPLLSNYIQGIPGTYATYEPEITFNPIINKHYDKLKRVDLNYGYSTPFKTQYKPQEGISADDVTFSSQIPIRENIKQTYNKFEPTKVTPNYGYLPSLPLKATNYRPGYELPVKYDPYPSQMPFTGNIGPTFMTQPPRVTQNNGQPILAPFETTNYNAQNVLMKYPTYTPQMPVKDFVQNPDILKYPYTQPNYGKNPLGPLQNYLRPVYDNSMSNKMQNYKPITMPCYDTQPYSNLPIYNAQPQGSTIDWYTPHQNYLKPVYDNSISNKMQNPDYNPLAYSNPSINYAQPQRGNNYALNIGLPITPQMPFKQPDIPDTHATYAPQISFKPNIGPAYDVFKSAGIAPNNIDIPFTSLKSANYIPQVKSLGDYAPKNIYEQNIRPFNIFGPVGMTPTFGTTPNLFKSTESTTSVNYDPFEPYTPPVPAYVFTDPYMPQYGTKAIDKTLNYGTPFSYSLNPYAANWTPYKGYPLNFKEENLKSYIMYGKKMNPTDNNKPYLNMYYGPYEAQPVYFPTDPNRIQYNTDDTIEGKPKPLNAVPCSQRNFPYLMTPNYGPPQGVNPPQFYNKATPDSSQQIPQQSYEIPFSYSSPEIPNKYTEQKPYLLQKQTKPCTPKSMLGKTPEFNEVISETQAKKLGQDIPQQLESKEMKPISVSIGTVVPVKDSRPNIEKEVHTIDILDKKPKINKVISDTPPNKAGLDVPYHTGSDIKPNLASIAVNPLINAKSDINKAENMRLEPYALQKKTTSSNAITEKPPIAANKTKLLNLPETALNNPCTKMDEVKTHTFVVPATPIKEVYKVTDIVTPEKQKEKIDIMIPHKTEGKPNYQTQQKPLNLHPVPIAVSIPSVTTTKPKTDTRTQTPFSTNVNDANMKASTKLLTKVVPIQPDTLKLHSSLQKDVHPKPLPNIIQNVNPEYYIDSSESIPKTVPPKNGKLLTNTLKKILPKHGNILSNSIKHIAPNVLQNIIPRYNSMIPDTFQNVRPNYDPLISNSEQYSIPNLSQSYAPFVTGYAYYNPQTLPINNAEPQTATVNWYPPCQNYLNSVYDNSMSNNLQNYKPTIMPCYDTQTNSYQPVYKAQPQEETLNWYSPYQNYLNPVYDKPMSDVMQNYKPMYESQSYVPLKMTQPYYDSQEFSNTPMIKTKPHPGTINWYSPSQNDLKAYANFMSNKMQNPCYIPQTYSNLPLNNAQPQKGTINWYPPCQNYLNPEYDNSMSNNMQIPYNNPPAYSNPPIFNAQPQEGTINWYSPYQSDIKPKYDNFMSNKMQYPCHDPQSYSNLPIPNAQPQPGTVNWYPPRNLISNNIQNYQPTTNPCYNTQAFSNEPIYGKLDDNKSWYSPCLNYIKPYDNFMANTMQNYKANYDPYNYQVAFGRPLQCESLVNYEGKSNAPQKSDSALYYTMPYLPMKQIYEGSAIRSNNQPLGSSINIQNLNQSPRSLPEVTILPKARYPNEYGSNYQTYPSSYKLLQGLVPSQKGLLRSSSPTMKYMPSYATSPYLQTPPLQGLLPSLSPSSLPLMRYTPTNAYLTSPFLKTPTDQSGQASYLPSQSSLSKLPSPLIKSIPTYASTLPYIEPTPTYHKPYASYSPGTYSEIPIPSKPCYSKDSYIATPNRPLQMSINPENLPTASYATQINNTPTNIPQKSVKATYLPQIESYSTQYGLPSSIKYPNKIKYPNFIKPDFGSVSYTPTQVTMSNIPYQQQFFDTTSNIESPKAISESYVTPKTYTSILPNLSKISDASKAEGKLFDTVSKLNKEKTSYNINNHNNVSPKLPKISDAKSEVKLTDTISKLNPLINKEKTSNGNNKNNVHKEMEKQYHKVVCVPIKQTQNNYYNVATNTKNINANHESNNNDTYICVLVHSNDTSKESVVNILKENLEKIISSNQDILDTLNTTNKQYDISLDNIVLANILNMTNSSIKLPGQNFDLQKVTSNIKVIKPKLILTEENLQVNNFIPVVKTGEARTPNSVQNIVNNAVEKVYKDPIVLRKSDEKKYPCLMMNDLCRLQPGRALIWPPVNNGNQWLQNWWYSPH